MDDFIFWIILIALAVIIGNQTRERQEKETKGMSKRKKEKYFQDIKNKQIKNVKTILLWLGMIILAIVLLAIIFLSD